MLRKGGISQLEYVVNLVLYFVFVIFIILLFLLAIEYYANNAVNREHNNRVAGERHPPQQLL